MVELRCHLCGHTKQAHHWSRVGYLLAFHMDRRHPGWTTQRDSSPFRDDERESPKSDVFGRDAAGGVQ